MLERFNLDSYLLLSNIHDICTYVKVNLYSVETGKKEHELDTKGNFVRIYPGCVLHMTQLRILGKLRYTWGPNFKVVLLMILVCQVNYYNIGSTLHKYECWEIDICRDICDICFYKKGALKLSKMLQLA